MSMSVTLLLYWLPIFVGVAFGTRLTTRRHGVILGVICAGLWAAVVEANTRGAFWQDPGMLVATLCGAAAIALTGYHGVGKEVQGRMENGEWRKKKGCAEDPNAAYDSEDAGCGLSIRDSGLWTGGASICGPGFALQTLISVHQQFDAWLEVHSYDDDPWTDFDEFLRSLLFHWVGGTYVKTYRVLSEGDQLIPLRELEARDALDMVSARRGVEGYVATTGRSFLAGDRTHGKLVDGLVPRTAGADGSPGSNPESEVQSSKFKVRGRGPENRDRECGLADETPAWCFAVTRGACKIGVVTVERFVRSLWGSATSETVPACPWSPMQLRLVELVVAQFWNALTEVCRSRTALIHDPGSSGLTRKAFFEIGREVLADACRQGEPVAVAVIGIEGLRGLDDEGQWAGADDIRATVSNVLKQRLRADDRLGRFDDSRFVLLLRRVDSGLAFLIMKQLIDRLSNVLVGRSPWGARVELRCGLAGSGVIGEASGAGKPSLEKLVATALELCRQARESSVRISSDLSALSSEKKLIASL
ncbi:MAG: hypothetical protein V2A79_14285 [Planctomycetota bacterium]